MIWDLFKIVSIVTVIKSPWLTTGILLGILVLFILMGIFIKFKNGILSWVLYFVLLNLLGVFAAASGYYLYNPPDDLQLHRTRIITNPTFCTEGVTYTKRLRRTTDPLIGVHFQSEEDAEEATEYIKEHYSSFIAKESKVYPGLLLMSGDTPINEVLIEQDFVSVDDQAPTIYRLRSKIYRDTPRSPHICVFILFSIWGATLVIMARKLIM